MVMLKPVLRTSRVWNSRAAGLLEGDLTSVRFVEARVAVSADHDSSLAMLKY